MLNLLNAFAYWYNFAQHSLHVMFLAFLLWVALSVVFLLGTIAHWLVIGRFEE